jgi:hypothetical protein
MKWVGWLAKRSGSSDDNGATFKKKKKVQKRCVSAELSQSVF